MIEMRSSRQRNIKGIHYGHAKRRVKFSFTFLFDKSYIRFATLYRHVVGIPMGTNSAPIVADLFFFFFFFFFCYERDFMIVLSVVKEAELIEAFNF